MFESHASIDAEKVLEELINKITPVMDYYTNHDIEVAIFSDAVDEGLSAAEINNAIPKMVMSCILDEIVFEKYNLRCQEILIGVGRIARGYLDRIKSAEEKQDEEGKEV